jgi:hypothetical protein
VNAQYIELGATRWCRSRTRDLAVRLDRHREHRRVASMRMHGALSASWGDLKSALRAARKDPMVTAIVVLSLAAGVGMNTLVYSAVDTILIRPLPYPDSDHLAVLYEGDAREADDRGGVAPADFLEWRGRVKSFSGIAATAGALFNLSRSADPERVQGSRVSASFFTEVLRTRLLVGRGFTTEEDEGAVPVVVLSYGLWQGYESPLAPRQPRCSAWRSGPACASSSWAS